MGSWLCPGERGNFILTVLEGMTQPRVSDTEVVTRTLDVVLKDASFQLSNVSSFQPDCPVLLPSGAAFPDLRMELGSSVGFSGR